MPQTEFAVGDRVVHPQRLEWGEGVISKAVKFAANGESGQKLTVRFDHAGLKTISTIHAPLTRAEESEQRRSKSDLESGDGDWLAALEGRSPAEVFAAIPERARDPFASLADRLTATLDLYRYERSGRSLLDWAIVQSGLRDPLSRFNRHELETHFQRFEIARDTHLKRVIDEVRKNPDDACRAALNQAPRASVPMLRRLGAVR